MHLYAFDPGKPADVDAGPRDRDHAQPGDSASSSWERPHQSGEQPSSHSRAPDGCDANDIVVAISQPAAQLAAIARHLLLQAKDVAPRELVMSLRPRAHLWQPEPKRAGNLVFGPPDED